MTFLFPNRPFQRRLALTLAGSLSLSLVAPCATFAADPPTLVTGKKITLPPLGTQQNVGSLPMALVLSPDGKYAVSSGLGFRQSLRSLSTATGLEVSQIKFDNKGYDPAKSQTNGLYFGLAFASDGTLFAAQGSNDTIAVVKLAADGTLSQADTIAAKKGDFPTGLALDGRGFLYVANNDPSTFSVPGSVAIYNATTKAEVGRFAFTGSFFGTPNFPLPMAALADGSRVYVGSQRDNAVYILNAANPAAPTLLGSIPTGAHPVGLLLNKAQTRLFVANAHSDTVSVVDTASNTVLRTILLRPEGARGLPGATPTNLALSPDEKTLYANLGDMNAVAVMDAVRFRLLGYIPTGWYPTGVAVSPDGRRLLVANAKGTQTRYPNPGYKEYTPALDPSQYGLNLIEGNVSTIALPASSGVLTGYTKQVIDNNRITPLTDNPPSNPLGKIGLQAGKIKHVIYIVKENRTFDQVLGDSDVPGVNGDPSLTLFGQNVTPNQHALAKRFVMLDNFYDCGEASGDGWPWSTQGIATEYVIKNLPYNYSGRGRNYDFEGQNNGYLVGGHPAKDPDGNTLSDLFPNGAPPIPDVSEAPNGHIWDIVQRAGLSFRNYGFFYSFGVTQGAVKVIPDNYPGSPGLQPAGRDLGGLSDFDYRRYDNDFADSDGPSLVGSLPSRTSYGKAKLPSRYAEWKREFDLMLAKDPTGGAVPNFMTVRFNRDHTQGLSPGKFSPRAEVADNDYAVGQLVEAVSKSAIWKETAIFVIEDDAQAGPDHVDSHRSICFAISPWIKKNTLDHTFYNTDSVLKTMELLLGLPAMSQYDAVADPIMAFDETPSNDAPFTAILPAASILSEKNPTLTNLRRGSAAHKLAVLSSKMDFAHPDSAPAQPLNEILWKSVKGVSAKMPAPRRGLILTAKKTRQTGANRDGDD